MRQFHADGTLPPGNSGHVFVFGSNLSGRHGGGAARAAWLHYGAQMGHSVGMTGCAYAIPTKTADIRDTLPLCDIAEYVAGFIRFARAMPHYKFWVTRIGCGLAGLDDAQVAPLFLDVPNNCNLPDTWREWIL